jgi:hypothetical protein
VFLEAHEGYHGMGVKYGHTMKGSGANPFVDAESYRANVAREEEAHRATLIAQRANQAR